MMEALLGAAGAALVLGAFGLGWGVGRWSRPSPRCAGPVSGNVSPVSGPTSPLPPARDESPAARLSDDERAAFETLMSYNAETAYGLNRGMGGDEQ